METEKKNNQRTKLSIYILDTIESQSTTRFKNRSSDRMMTSDWLVDVSDDRYTTLSSEQFYSYYVWHELLKNEMMIISVLYKTNSNMIANSVGCFLFFLTSCLSSPTCLIISFTNQNKEKVNSCPLPLLPYIYILFL